MQEQAANEMNQLVKQAGKNYKGRDIGYALAAASCEGAHSVDACTVTTPWCDLCFRSSEPQPLLAEPVGFFCGPAASAGCPALADHPVYFGPAILSFRQPFQPSTQAKLTEHS